MLFGIGIVFLLFGGGVFFKMIAEQADHGTNLLYFMGTMVVPAILILIGIYLIKRSRDQKGESSGSASRFQFTKQNVIALSSVSIILGFIYFVWPTPYRYDHMKTGDNQTPVRINRFTGTTERLTYSGWYKNKRQSTGPAAAAQVETSPVQLPMSSVAPLPPRPVSQMTEEEIRAEHAVAQALFKQLYPDIFNKPALLAEANKRYYAKIDQGKTITEAMLESGQETQDHHHVPQQ